MTSYGRILSVKPVKLAVERTLRAWTPHYLAELERQEGLPARTLLPFRSWARPAGAPSSWNQSVRTMPACFTRSPGIIGEPETRGGGKVRLTWAVGVMAVVTAADYDATADLAGQYGAAVRAALLQHGGLADPADPDRTPFASGLDLLDEQYTEVADNQTVQAATVLFAVTVDHVVDRAAGPKTLPPDPYAAPVEHTADTIDVDVEVMQ